MAIGRNGRSSNGKNNNVIFKEIFLPPGTDMEKFLRNLAKEFKKSGVKALDNLDQKISKKVEKVLGVETAKPKATVKKKPVTKAKKKATKTKSKKKK